MTDIPPDLRYNPAEMKRRGYGPEAVENARRAAVAHAAAVALAAAVEKAFPPLPRPLITLHVAKGLDDEWNLTNERAAELRALDPETDWRDIPAEAVRNFQEYFTFADPGGRRFYLPAFLFHHLREFPYVGSDAIFISFERGDDFGELTSEQLHCVERFKALCLEYATS